MKILGSLETQKCRGYWRHWVTSDTGVTGNKKNTGLTGDAGVTRDTRVWRPRVQGVLEKLGSLETQESLEI